MKLKTFYSIPIEVELDHDEQCQFVGDILRSHYHDNYGILEDDVRADMARLHQYFTGKPIDYLER